MFICVFWLTSKLLKCIIIHPTIKINGNQIRRRLSLMYLQGTVCTSDQRDSVQMESLIEEDRAVCWRVDGMR